MRRRVFVGLLAAFGLCGSSVANELKPLSVKLMKGHAVVTGDKASVEAFAMQYMDNLYPAWRLDPKASRQVRAVDYSKGRAIFSLELQGNYDAFAHAMLIAALKR